MTYFPSTPLSVLNFTYQCGDNQNCKEIRQKISPGTYLFEVWGAQGGNTTDNNGGRGGYSQGLISFCKTTVLHIFIGAKGATPYSDDFSAETDRSFNGGGKGYYQSDERGVRYGSSGGGATDIRINGNELKNRIIIAGGGGGAGCGYNIHFSGGFGGGIKGGDSQSDNYQPGLGANQTHGGQKEVPGTPGQGGDHKEGLAGAGGGGGYYGGGSGEKTGASGGGGSGFICMDKSCGFYFIKGMIKSGNDMIPDFYTNKEIQGNYGNGFARISLLTTNFNCIGTIKYRKNYISINQNEYIFVFVLSK